MTSSQSKNHSGSKLTRRHWLESVGGIAMAGGLLAGYGTFAGYALRFLYPPRPADKVWLLVAPIGQMQKGDNISFRTPGGAKVAIARQGEGDEVESFIALGSTCPHLGCQVFWEGQNNRFFCPCHNGEFDPSGKGIGGPPGEAGQSLPRYPLKIETGLLYIQVPAEGLPQPRAESEEA